MNEDEKAIMRVCIEKIELSLAVQDATYIIAKKLEAAQAALEARIARLEAIANLRH